MWESERAVAWTAMRGFSGLCGVLAGLWAAVSCSSPAYEDKPLFGELPYPLPSEGSMTQSIAMLKRPYTAFDLLLESGCVTFAEVHCDGASPANIDLWRFCRQEGHWRQLPSDA